MANRQHENEEYKNTMKNQEVVQRCSFTMEEIKYANILSQWQLTNK